MSTLTVPLSDEQCRAVDQAQVLTRDHIKDQWRAVGSIWYKRNQVDGATGGHPVPYQLQADWSPHRETRPRVYGGYSEEAP